MVYYLIAENTIEETILRMLDHKEQIVDNVTDGGLIDEKISIKQKTNLLKAQANLKKLSKKEDETKAKTKLESEKLKAAKFTQKQKDKKAKGWKALKKEASKRVTYRRVVKKSQASVTIPGGSDYRAPSVLNDPNRFFKNELNKTKRSLFF